MSRRSNHAEIVLVCKGCADRTPIANIHLDDEGEPVVTTTAARRDRMEYSFVRELVTPASPPHVPQKVVLFCDREHVMRVNLTQVVAELAEMPRRRIRRAV